MASRHYVLVGTLSVLLATSLACDAKPPTQPSIVTPVSLNIATVAPQSAEVGRIVDIVVRGSGFESGATATMDGAAAAVTFVNTSALNIRVPLHAVGVVDLVVTNPGGQVARLAAAFEHLAPLVPTVSLVSPDSGLVYGDMIDIIGSRFQPGVKVTLDGVEAITTTTTSTNIFAFPARHAAGAVDVVVTNPNGQSVTVSGGYTYQEVFLVVSATQVAPGAPLTITWTAPSGRPALDWLGLFRVDDPDTLLWSSYTSGAVSGSRTLAAPAQPGQYEFLYLVDDHYFMAGRSSIVTVGAEGNAGPVTTSRPPDLEMLFRGRLRGR